MKNRRLFPILASLLAFTLGATACGGRIPSPKTAQSVTRSYFKRYGNKYKTSLFGGKNVGAVGINAVEEISKNTAYTDAVVELNRGGAARTLLKMEKHFPTGWRVVSWELLDQR